MPHSALFAYDTFTGFQVRVKVYVVWFEELSPPSFLFVKIINISLQVPLIKSSSPARGGGGGGGGGVRGGGTFI